jgi:hypothetical protein
MDQLKNMSLAGQIVVAAVAIIVVFIVLQLVLKILQALMGVAVFILIVAGLIWVFNKAREA